MNTKLRKLFLVILGGALGCMPGASLCAARSGQGSKPPVLKRAKSQQGVKATVQDPAFKRVNKKISLGCYKPANLVKFQGVMVSKRIVLDLKRLLAAAKADGLTLKVVSGYRSYEKQIQVYNSWIAKEMAKNRALTRSEAEKRADSYSARPGHSEHQLGTTVDILSAENGYQFSADRKWKYVAWLERNACRFNFKISYGPDHPEYEYEPWHIRWYPADGTRG